MRVRCAVVGGVWVRCVAVSRAAGRRACVPCVAIPLLPYSIVAGTRLALVVMMILGLLLLLLAVAVMVHSRAISGSMSMLAGTIR